MKNLRTNRTTTRTMKQLKKHASTQSGKIKNQTSKTNIKQQQQNNKCKQTHTHTQNTQHTQNQLKNK